MALNLSDHWVWDHWILSSDDYLDLFFLRASRALINPAHRHTRASIGHARSYDNGLTWHLLPDALVHNTAGTFDDRATWTGSAIHHPNGGIRLFYTGISSSDHGRKVQRIGWADSSDGISFTRMSHAPLEADERWYEAISNTDGDIAWRDPFVFQFHDQWHMFITARLKDGDHLSKGVIGHAISEDLDTWSIQEPLTSRSQFGHLECAQSRTIDGRHYLVFSCASDMQMTPCDGGVWFAEGASPVGPFDLENARYAEPTNLYASQMFQTTSGEWKYTGFDGKDDLTFTGTIPNPIPWENLVLVSPR
ncbi:MAG: glycosyl hydrolase family 32 [Actinomycetaceae bacterium]|nr:glycosyl hydrolase family 32 [Actinomycetaceae bacterium]